MEKKDNVKTRNPYKVFVSSTYCDNAKRRKIVQDAVTMAEMVWHGMEIFTAETKPVKDVCLKYAAEADLFVGIIAWRYGWQPDGDKSITEMEYDAAKEAGKVCLMFQLDPKIPANMEVDFDDGIDKWKKQDKLEAFKKRFSEDQLSGYFDENTLGVKVLAALNKWRELQGNVLGKDSDNISRASSLEYDPNEVLGAYRNILKESLQRLPLRGIDIGGSDPTSDEAVMELEQVYVQLDTKTSTEKGGKERKDGIKLEPDELAHKEMRSLSALEAVARNRSVVILGDPGSGKSTFVNHLTLRFLMRKGYHDIKDEEGNSIWPESEVDLLPIHIVLRDFAKSVSDTGEQAEARHLWEFICKRLKDQELDYADEIIKKALQAGTAIVLLDGLDEIPTKEVRSFVRDAVERFSQRYQKSRFVVTCRVLSYQNPEWQLNNKAFPSFELAPFDSGKIDCFISAWYSDLERMKALNKATADNLQVKLREAVKRDDLSRIASNPLLLTVMALVNTHKGRLPDARALLYEETVEILLWRWEQIKRSDEKDLPRLRELLIDAGRTDIDLKKCFWQLAYNAHKGSNESDSESLAGITQWDLLKGLAALHPDRSMDWAEQVVETTKMRAGLLLERDDEVYTFPHRTFQEYLAGAHLSSLNNFAEEALSLIESSSLWREVILLATGRLVYLSGDIDKPLALVGELLTKAKENDENGWRSVWLAGEVLVEIGPNRIKDRSFGIELKERVQGELVELLEGGCLNPVERAAAGTVLGYLGDPRFDPERWYLPVGESYGFVEIPEGQFSMGSDSNTDKDAFDWEKPKHTVNLSKYSISKYPVTVAQFRVFIEDSGYDAGKEWKIGMDNHPVVDVSWDDAVTYCKWLSQKLNEKGLGEVRLPTEAEWEKAARGAKESVYPWGNKPDINKMNYNETGIGCTSPVGCFPGCDNPYGLLDMNGNVDEWVLDRYNNSYYANSPENNPQGPTDGVYRVIRGGSWASFARDCRSAFRFRLDPDFRNYFAGFRLVLPRSAELKYK